MSTFVTLGNAKQPFPRLIEAVENIMGHLPSPVIVQAGYTPWESDFLEILDFMEMGNFVEHIEKARVVITHAGAGTIIHAIKAGKVPVVVPRKAEYKELIDNHQVELAACLSLINKVVSVEKPDEKLLQAVEKAIKIQSEVSFLSDGEPPILQLVRNLFRGYEKDLLHVEGAS